MRRMWRALEICALAVLASSGVSAQTVGAGLQGTVYDPSGAVVPNASIEIRSVDKGSVRTLRADDRGRYRDPLLLPGAYELRVTAPGFQAVVLKGVELSVG